LRVQTRIVHEEKENRVPRALISTETREKIFSHSAFKGARLRFEEVGARHMERLRYLSEKKTPCVVAMRATMGSPLVQFLDQMISLPILVYALDKSIFVVAWMGSRVEAARWRETFAEKQVVRARLLEIVKDAEASRVADMLSTYWRDAFYPDEVAWRQLREGMPDDVDDDMAYPTVVTDTKVAWKPTS